MCICLGVRVCVGSTVRKERQIPTAGREWDNTQADDTQADNTQKKHAKHLKNTAAVAVRGNVEAVAGNCVVDELIIVCVKLLQAALNHVVACRRKD